MYWYSGSFTVMRSALPRNMTTAKIAASSAAMIVTGSSRSFLLICFRSIFIFLIDNSRILCDIFFLVQGVQVHHIQIDHASLLCGGCMMTDGSPQ